MIGYELKKLARRPVFLLVLLCVLGFKTAYTLSGIAEIRPEAEYVRLVKEYSAYTLDEAERRIKIDAAEAEEQFFRDYESEYNEGKLTIEEFREFQREYSARAARYSATQNVLAQVERLTSHENGDSGAAGLGIRVIDETGWLLAGRLCPLILVFVAVAILCEWHDDEMYDLLRTTSNGVRRSMRVKMSLCLGIMLVVSLIDASGTYLIPRLLYGLDCPDAAVQSVSLYAKLADCLTLRAYALRSVLAGIAADMAVGLAWTGVALVSKKSYRTTGILLALALLVILVR